VTGKVALLTGQFRKRTHVRLTFFASPVAATKSLSILSLDPPPTAYEWNPISHRRFPFPLEPMFLAGSDCARHGSYPLTWLPFELSRSFVDSPVTRSVCSPINSSSEPPGSLQGGPYYQRFPDCISADELDCLASRYHYLLVQSLSRKVSIFKEIPCVPIPSHPPFVFMHEALEFADRFPASFATELSW